MSLYCYTSESELCCVVAGRAVMAFKSQYKWCTSGGCGEAKIMLFNVVSFGICEVAWTVVSIEGIPLPLPITWGWPSRILVTMTVFCDAVAQNVYN